MKIMVAVKRVIDHNIKVRVRADNKDVDLDHVKMSINPFDEIALEEAVRQKEQNKASEVIAVSIGCEECCDILRSALALGADRAIHIPAEQNFESLTIAKILAKLAQQEGAAMVFLGKQAIDSDASQSAAMLSAKLNWGLASFVSKLELEKDYAIATCEIDEGRERLKLKYPFIMSADLRLNEPRYLSLPNIMRAKRQEIRKISLEELDIEPKKHIEITEVKEPILQKQPIFCETIDVLIAALKEKQVI